MAKAPIIAGNWKMHKTIRQAVDFIHALCPLIEQAEARALIAPPFTAIAACVEAAKHSKVEIGAQNMSDADEGAFTGEISAQMLKEAGASFVLLGHSERRAIFRETNEHIHHKLVRAIQSDLPPILCIGESEADRDAKRSEEVLFAQIDGCLGSLSATELEGLIIAYEPVWAIGTGRSATAEIAQNTHLEIRGHLVKKWGKNFAKNLPILYGGSVKPNNIQTLINQPDIDGALIGGASLDVEAFTQMVNL